MTQLALTIPGFDGTPITAPSGVPTGGMTTAGGNLLTLVVNFMFVGGVLLSIVFVIYSGIQWVLSGGDKTALQAARQRLIYSIIGLIVFLAGFFIVSVAITLLGANPSFFFKYP